MKKTLLLPVLFILFLTTAQAQQYATLPKQGFDLILMFDPNVKPEAIERLRKQLNANEIAITPFTQTRLWRKNTGNKDISYSASEARDTSDRIRTGGGTTSVGGGVWIQINKPTGLTYKRDQFTPNYKKPMPVLPNCPKPTNYQLSGSQIGKSSVKIALLDTGLDCNETGTPVRFNNPYLSPFIVDSKSFCEYQNARDSRIGHGTAVASVIVRTFWEANSRNCGIIPIKVLDSDGNGNVFNLLQGIDYALQKDVDIINISLISRDAVDYTEGMPIQRLLQQAAAKNILVVSAAGNDSKNIDLVENYVFPACANLQNQIVVGGSKCEESLWGMSNYGRKKVDIFAPGEGVAVLDLSGASWLYGQGTSLSAAIVTGVAAVLKTQQYNRNYATLKCAILNGASRYGTFTPFCNTGGVINAFGAFEKFSSCPK